MIKKQHILMVIKGREYTQTAQVKSIGMFVSLAPFFPHPTWLLACLFTVTIMRSENDSRKPMAKSSSYTFGFVTVILFLMC